MNLVILMVLLGLMTGIEHLGLASDMNLAARTMTSFGFLILVGYVLGGFAAKVKLPRITGYLVAGILFGPDMLNIVRIDVRDNLQFINEIALSFIALTAGGELIWSALSRRINGIINIVIMQTAGGFLLVTLIFWVLFLLVPPLEHLNPTALFAMAAILGIISTATSPATTVAVIVESRAKGPMKDTILGATILMDVVIIIAFSLVMSAITPLLNPAAGDSGNLLTILFHILFSVIVGLVSGWAAIGTIRHFPTHLTLKMLALGVFIVTIAHDFHLDALLVAVTTGFMISNFSSHGAEFLEAVEKASLPIYLVFFALAGAGLDLSVLTHLLPLALLLVSARMLGKGVTIWSASRWSKLEPEVQKYGWMGFLGQAGVSLGFITIVEQTLPVVGGWLKQVVVAGIIINQIIGPVLLKWAFDRTGESQNSR